MDLSIIICTRNRSMFLRNLLNDVMELSTPSSFNFDVVVIDNGSSDKTAEVVHQFQQVRYIYEPNVGLSIARNRGIEEANGTYIAYLDDECRIDERWLKRAAVIISEKRPLAFGGPFRACYISEKPKWYKNEYGSLVKTNESRYLKANENLAGGNMFIRSAVLKELGGFNEKLGMVGTKVAYEEDTEFVNRIRNKYPGDNIYYDLDLWVYHTVRPEKMKFSRLVVESYKKGLYKAILEDGQRVSNNLLYHIALFIYQIIMIVTKTIKGVFLYKREGFAYIQQYIIEAVLIHVSMLSKQIVYIRKLSA